MHRAWPIEVPAVILSQISAMFFGSKICLVTSRDEIGFADATRLSKSRSVEWQKLFDDVDSYISSTQKKPRKDPIFVKIFAGWTFGKSELSTIFQYHLF